MFAEIKEQPAPVADISLQHTSSKSQRNAESSRIRLMFDLEMT